MQRKFTCILTDLIAALSEDEDENCDDRDYDDEEDPNRADCEYYDDGDEQQDNGGLILLHILSNKFHQIL